MSSTSPLERNLPPFTHNEHLALTLTRRVTIVATLFFITLGATGGLMIPPGTVLFYVSVSAGGIAMALFLVFCIWECAIQIKGLQFSSKEQNFPPIPASPFQPPTTQTAFSSFSPTTSEATSSSSSEVFEKNLSSSSEELPIFEPVPEPAPEPPPPPPISKASTSPFIYISPPVASRPSSSSSSSSSLPSDEEQEVTYSPPSTPPLAEPSSSYLDSLKAFVDDRIKGGDIQKRNYYYLLCPLIREMLIFFNRNVAAVRFLSIKEVVDQVKKHVEEDKDFSFLSQPSNEFEHHYAEFIKNLFTLCENTIHPQDRRKYVLDALNTLQKTDEYKKALSAIKENQAAYQYFRPTKLILMIFKIAWTEVSVFSLGQQSVDAVLSESHTDTEYFFNQRGKNLLHNGKLKDACQKINLPDSIKFSSTCNHSHNIASDFRAIHSSEILKDRSLALFNSARGHFNVFFRPLFENNYMEVLWHSFYEFNNRLVKICHLRFGTPTEQLGSSVSVAGIFLGFLDCLSLENRILVSFHHQNPQVKAIGKGDESTRVQAMLDIPQSNYQKTYFPFLFAMDGNWYHQEDEYEKEENAKLFKINYKKFLANPEEKDSKLNTNPYNICWNQLFALGIDKKKVLDEIEAIFDNIHTLFYQEKENLTKEERTIFINISYIYLEEYFVLLLQKYMAIDEKEDEDSIIYVHDLCKDAKDRTILIVALKFWRDLVRTGKIDDIKERQRFRHLIHYPGIFIKGTPMDGGEKEQIGGRAITFLEVLNFLEQNLLEGNAQESFKQDSIIKVLGDKYIFKNTFIIKDLDQSLSSLPAEAKTREEYIDLVTRDRNAPSHSHAAEIPEFGKKFLEGGNMFSIFLKILNYRYAHLQFGFSVVPSSKDPDGIISTDQDEENDFLYVKAKFKIQNSNKEEIFQILAEMKYYQNYDHAVLSWSFPKEKSQLDILLSASPSTSLEIFV